MDIFKRLAKQLVVSCQALEDEPLHSPYMMGKMAVAAQEGGAKGIRANSVVDIQAIKEAVDLPVIGIIKRVYGDNDVFITPTLKEVTALLEIGVEMIATDATDRTRPNNEQLENIVHYVKEHHPKTALMADISSISEAIAAEKLGFDCVSTTLIGYTEKSQGENMVDDYFALLKEIVQAVSIPVIAEGKIDTPLKAAKALEHGASFVVVGSAITRPQLITKSFSDAMM